MINSIQHFQEQGVKNLTEIFSHYTDDLTKFAEMVYGVTKEVTKLGLSLIEEELESYDELLRKRQDLRKGWYIERRDETKLLTSLGEICYSRTYFHNKETGEYCYLLDRLMGLESHARILEDAEAGILEEAVTESETKAKAVESAKNYILGNWAGIMESVRAKDKSLQCSAEGHVSHIYSDRMSSRPLGWSRTGADKMARLRIYRQNKRNILELVRYQKKELPLAAGAEEVIYSATQMLAAERRNKNRLGKLADMPVYSIPYPQIKKIAALKNHIWGL